MYSLTILNHDGVQVVDSREVAAAIDKQHKNLVRDIRGYIDIIANAGESQTEFNGLKIEPVDFFIPGEYQDNKGETRPCYLLTRKGCDMVANKLTGEKGVLFTAAYVTAFEQMREQLAAACVPISQVSLGSVASIIRVMRSVMLDAGRTPSEIEQMAVGICHKWGVPLPPMMPVGSAVQQKIPLWENGCA